MSLGWVAGRDLVEALGLPALLPAVDFEHQGQAHNDREGCRSADDSPRENEAH